MNLLTSLRDTARLVYPEPTLGDRLSRLKFFLRGLASPALTTRWFSFLESPQLQPLVRRHPYIFSKLQRPYLHRRLHAWERLAVLSSHYHFVTQRLGPEMLQDIITSPGYLLANLPELHPNRCTLRLAYFAHSKEGELTLVLYDEDFKGFLFALAFCISRFSHAVDTELFIGGLQGSKSLNRREVIVQTTRSLHGLRPKALLIFALQQLARIWNISTIRAVAQEEHIYRHYRKRKSLYANYDQFWIECQGTLQPNHNFQLPVLPVTRDLHLLPRNKRPVYRRRYAMLGRLAEEIEANLAKIDSPSQQEQVSSRVGMS